MKRLSFALLGLFCTLSALAQPYPSRSVKIIVPFGVGGPADIYARFVGARLGDAMGQPFVVENRPGAGAVIGSDAVAKSAPDGYTLLMMSNTHTTNESLIPNKPYELMRDFVPVATINYSDLLMVVHPSVPAKTVPEFVAWVKAQDGKASYASLTMARLPDASLFRVKHSPQRIESDRRYGNWQVSPLGHLRRLS